MYISVISKSPTEPITLTRAKEYLRVENDLEDELITDFIKYAREYAENFINRPILTTTYEAGLTYSEYLKGVTLPVPLLSVGEIKRVSDNFTMVLNTDYTVDIHTGKICFKTNIVDEEEGYPVTISYTSGFSEVPGHIIRALLFTIGFWYENREDALRKLPTAAEQLMYFERDIPV